MGRRGLDPPPSAATAPPRGEPATFKDRLLLRTNPYQVLSQLHPIELGERMGDLADLDLDQYLVAQHPALSRSASRQTSWPPDRAA
jgi:hypothetical protein